MILVTVGTPSNDFTRLVKKIDDLIENKTIREKVIIQIGYTNYIPKHSEWFRFINPEKIESFYKKSTICITHGGIGSIITSLKYKKPTIVVPRLKKFNEHIDDHQIQIVKELEKQKKIIAVYDIDDLEKSIKKAVKLKSHKLEEKSKILNLIEEFIQKN